MKSLNYASEFEGKFLELIVSFKMYVALPTRKREIERIENKKEIGQKPHFSFSLY